MSVVEQEAYKSAEKSVRNCCIWFSYEPATPSKLLDKNTK
ncbi:AgrD family cyclic lactone autoinducer peptide [Listeria booriae]